MKKFASLLLAALLCLSMFTVASAEASLTLLYSLEDSQWIDGSNLLRVEERSGYAMATMDGTALTEAKYTRNFEYDHGVVVATEYIEGFNHTGILNLDGTAMTEFKYGDVKVLNQYFALGFVLVPATVDSYDYEDYSEDLYFNIDTVDVINLTTGSVIMTFARANFRDYYAEGKGIKIEDRSTGKVSAYDLEGNVLGTDISSVYSSDYVVEEYTTFRSNGQYGIQDAEGNVILEPSFYSICLSSGYRGYVPVSDGEKEGLVDLQGNVVVPCIYDDINYTYYATSDVEEDYDYVSYGYICVEKDGKLGYVDTVGNVTCEPKYAANNLDNNGCSATFTDMAGNFNILAADGVETPITGYQRVYPMYYGGGMFYYVYNDNYDYGVIDWHGNVVVPCEYDDVDLSGDGKYLMLTTGEYCEIYEIAVTETTADKSGKGSASGKAAPEAACETDNAAVVALLDSALALLGSDASANGTAVVGILTSMTQLLAGNDAAVSVINSAITLLDTDAAANGASVITLLQTVQAMI